MATLVGIYIGRVCCTGEFGTKNVSRHLHGE